MYTTIEKDQLVQDEKKRNFNNYWKKLSKDKELLWDMCQLGNLKQLNNLIDHKINPYPVDVNSKGLDNWTALHYATIEGHYKVVEYLLE